MEAFLTMTIQPRLVIGCAFLMFAGGCSQQTELARTEMRPASPVPSGVAGSSSESPVIRKEETEPEPGASVTTGQGAPPTTGGPQDDALRVRVQDLQDMTVEIITLACAGDCADIKAVANGGNPPYSFTWEDGSTAEQRHVCLDKGQALSVSATDTAIVSAEFGHEAKTVSTEVDARVLDCSDTPPPSGGPFCIKNPSLEGTPSIGIGTPESVPADWMVCLNTPDIGPSLATLMPQEGQSYLALATFADSLEVAGGQFCEPAAPGVALPFQVELTLSSTYGFGEATLEIWGGMTSCSKDELLWTSPPLTQVDAWQTFCGTLLPTQAFPFITIVPAPAPGVPTAYVLLDNFRAASGCE